MYGYKNTLYKLTFPNGVVYIGVTQNRTSRWYGDGQHYKDQKVGEAIKEFGWNNIKKETLLQLPSTKENAEIIRKMEKELIKAYDEKSYNVMCTSAYHETVVVRNKSNSHKRIYWEINGETKSMDEWCKMFNTSQSTVLGRVNGFGLSLHQALSFPKVPNNKWRLDPIGYWKSLGLLDENFEHKPIEVV